MAKRRRRISNSSFVFLARTEDIIRLLVSLSTVSTMAIGSVRAVQMSTSLSRKVNEAPNMREIEYGGGLGSTDLLAAEHVTVCFRSPGLGSQGCFRSRISSRTPIYSAHSSAHTAPRWPKGSSWRRRPRRRCRERPRCCPRRAKALCATRRYRGRAARHPRG